jgi:hypothetical protein
LVAANHGRTQGVGMYFPVTGKDGTFRVASLPEGAYLISVMSTPAGTGAQIKKDQTAEVSIDVAPMLGAGQPAGANVPPVREHPRRLRQMRQMQQEQGAEGDPAVEGATPSP